MQLLHFLPCVLWVSFQQQALCSQPTILGKWQCWSSVGQNLCEAPLPDNGEEVCQGHNYSVTECQALSCCHWDEGQCWSSVGLSLCVAPPAPLPGNGEEVCEGHNYNVTECQALACCHW